MADIRVTFPLKTFLSSDSTVGKFAGNVEKRTTGNSLKLSARKIGNDSFAIRLIL